MLHIMTHQFFPRVQFLLAAYCFSIARTIDHDYFLFFIQLLLASFLALKLVKIQLSGLPRSVANSSYFLLQNRVYQRAFADIAAPRYQKLTAVFERTV
jgi:uncharacterized membrane protein